MSLLSEILQHVAEPARIRRISRLRLGNYFTVVELDDEAVGASMSCYRLEPQDLAAAEETLGAIRVQDPLLLRFLFEEAHDDFVAQALRVAILSALSAPMLRRGGDASFSVAEDPPFDLLSGARSAVIFGFGGYLNFLATDPRIERLHIADLSYRRRRAEMDAMVEMYRRRRPELCISISDGFDTTERLRGADVAFITGSALCNGTLEGLLEACESKTRVVVQGQSASVHPKPLFERGVDLVITTIKPPTLVDIADQGRLPEILEGRLPELYLSSRPEIRQGTGPIAGTAAVLPGWFERHAPLFRQAGYSAWPERVYTPFLEVVDRPGKVLELGCGNGLLLRFLKDHSPHSVQPYGVESSADRLRQAQSLVFPEAPERFFRCDLRQYDFAAGPFSTIITNPLYADRGYYEQRDGLIQQLYADGSIKMFVRRCFDNLARPGRLILFCYTGQLREIEPWRMAFDREMAGVPFRAIEAGTGALTFFISDSI